MTKTQYLNSITPLIDSGLPPQSVSVNQTLTIGGKAGLSLTGPTSVQIQVNGPQTSITEADISGVYPAPASTNSPDDFLAHIALRRRTLPWERKGPQGQKPWLALLLLKDSELQASGSTVLGGGGGGFGAGQVFTPYRQLVRSGPSVLSGTVQSVQSRDAAGFASMVAHMPATTAVNLLFLRNSLFTAIRPDISELKFLSTVKRTNTTDNPADDVDIAIVIGNRLPDASGSAPELHTAFLVSLEGRDDAYAPSRSGNGEIGLVVLHSWSFTPSKGGDFEEVIRAIHIRPNGGVQRFGNLPKEPAEGATAPLSGGFDGILDQHGLFLDPLPHTQAGAVSYRGPLRPFPTARRSSGFAIRSAPEEFEGASADQPQDYSNATAFELGRLLALASEDMLEGLREINGIIKPVDVHAVAVNKLPLALQKPEWVVNPALEISDPWEMLQGNAMTSVIKTENQFVGATPGDVAGVGQQLQQFGSQVAAQLNSMQVAGIAQVSQIDINNVTTVQLEKQFGGTMAKGQI